MVREDRHIPPEYGWRVKLNHEFVEKPRVFVFPRLSQVSKLAGFAYRYVRFTHSERKKGKQPIIDPYAVGACKQIYGVPIGGIGAGTIGRGWRGDFNRWQLTPGMYTYNTVDVNQFTVCIRKNNKTVYQQVLSTCSPSGRMYCDKSLQGWSWNFDGGRAFYHALYPRAWTVYEIPECSLRLTCRQISPVFPNNYKDTSLPVGTFVWKIENVGVEDLVVTIMFTFQNGDGGAEDSAGGHYNEEFFCKGVYSKIKLQNVEKEQDSNQNKPSQQQMTSNTKSLERENKHLDTTENNKPQNKIQSQNSMNKPNIQEDSDSKHNTTASENGDKNISDTIGIHIDRGTDHSMGFNDHQIDTDFTDLANGRVSQNELGNPNMSTNELELKSNVDENNNVRIQHSSLKEQCITHDVNGVLLHHKGLKQKYTLAIAAMQVREDDEEIVNVSTKVRFDPKSPCRKLWEDLMDDGELVNMTGDSMNRTSYPGQTLAAAVAARTQVKAGCSQEVHFVLAWDQPIIGFGAKSEVNYCRRYTKFFGSKGNAAPSMCCYALQNSSLWEDQIEEWQNPILADSDLPSWFKSALFNELYFVADGGTIWLDIKRKKDTHGNIIPAHVKKYGRFAYLEGHEYRMYNTYDVHFYASWALAMLWPNLELSVQYDIASSVLTADNELRLIMMSGLKAARKIAGCVPHDLGDPDDEPFARVNAYCIHDTSEWKDLNLHFVLQVYRDYHLSEDKTFLMDMWPAIKSVMAYSTRQDTDGDGLIDNSGFADNTFDCWVVTGPSAYTGGLWLSALRCTIKIAEMLDLKDSVMKYNGVLERGKRAFERKLWNGLYFNYDGSENDHHDIIMAGQCAGYWYLDACDLNTIDDEEVFRKEQIKSTLKTIFQNNVMKFEGGFMGAVNGMKADGTLDKDSLQAEEVWTGVTYALGATMIQQGMIREGFRTAEGIYRTVYEKWGLGFQTPEAFTSKKTFRSRGYMRPLSIWSMHYAHLKRLNSKSESETETTFSQYGETIC